MKTDPNFVQLPGSGDKLQSERFMLISVAYLLHLLLLFCDSFSRSLVPYQTPKDSSGFLSDPSAICAKLEMRMIPSNDSFRDSFQRFTSMLSEPKIPWGSPLEGSLEGFSRIPWMDASQLCKMLYGLSRSSPKWFIPLLTVDSKSNWALIMAVSSKLLVVNQIIPCESMIMRWFSCVMFEML